MQYLGTDDQGTNSFSLQDFEPSFGSKLNASVREAWLESYGPVAKDWWNSSEDDGTKRLSAVEAQDYAKTNGGGVKLNITPKDGQYTAGQWGTIVSRQRELAAVKDVRERTPWDMGSVVRGGAMFGAGIVDPINLATAFVPWTKAIPAAAALRTAAVAESALTRAGARAALGAADAGISTAVMEPAFSYARNQLGDDYGALDSMANIAFGTAFGGGLHVIGGAASDVWKGYKGTPSPMVTPNPAMDTAAPLAGAASGMDTRVKVGDAYEPARWSVMEADTLQATVDKADNQFRDRSRPAYQAEIQSRANALDPALVLGDSPVMDIGAPTLAADGRIVAGNGRTLFISKAYEIGKGGDYRAALEARLGELGIDVDAVRGMKKPVLVRQFTRDVDIKKASILSNEGGATDMSPLEQAKVDAERLGDTRLAVNADGDINNADNRAAIRKWVEAQPENKRNSIMDSDGKLSPEGLRRLNGAMLFKAYGDTPVLARLIEAVDPGSRNLALALGRTASVVANTRAAIAAGDLHPLDIAADLQQAVEKYNQLREQGMKVPDYMAQLDAFGDGLTPEATMLLDFMGRNIQSPRRIMDAITGFADRLTEAGNPKQSDMFGASPMPDKTSMLKDAIAAAEARTDSAAEVVAGLAPETREAAMRASVAQSVDGRNVDVESVVGMDPGRKTHTLRDAEAAADRNFSPEEVSVADADASAAVQARVDAAPKWAAVKDAEDALADADTLLADTVKAGDQAFKYSRAKENIAPVSRTPSKTPVYEALRQLSRFDESFQMGDSGAVDLSAIAAEMQGGDGVATKFTAGEGTSLSKGKRVPTLSLSVNGPDGTPQKLLEIFDHNSKTPYVVIGNSDLGQGIGGARAYQIAFAWAHNNNKRMRPDSAGLTVINRLRRSEAMISSALRFGTTKHLEPHRDQYIGLTTKAQDERIEPQDTTESNVEVRRQLDELKSKLWQNGDSDAIIATNVQNLINASGQLALLREPNLAAFEVSGGKLRIRDDVARNISLADGTLDDAAGEADVLGVKLRPASTGVGASTVKRFAVSASIQRAINSSNGESAAGNASDPGVGGAEVRAVQTIRAVLGDLADGPSGDLNGALYARGVPPEQAPEFLTESLRQSFGTSTERLMQEGRIKLVATPDDIPGGPHPGDVKAATAPDGTVYVVAQNVSELEVRGILLHEVGAHVGMENMLGADVFQSVLKELDDAIGRGEEWAQAARDRVPSDTPAGLVREEQLAYLVQHAPELSIVQRIIAAVRAWAYRTFEFARETVKGDDGKDRTRVQLTEADFRAMAVSALHEAARGEQAGVLAGAYARAGGAADQFRQFLSANRDYVENGLRRRLLATSDNFVIREVPLDSVRLLQSGEDYINDSSKYTADQIRRGTAAERRPEDLFPIRISSDGAVLDGHHRHAAAVMNGEGTILALVPAGPGTGKVLNLAEFGGTPDPAMRYSRGETPDTSATKDDLKSYDDAVKRAKGYASVLRSAADKLENDAQATAAMRAAMPDITPQEINDLLFHLRKQVKGLRGMTRSARDALGADEKATGLQYEAMRAADTLANNLELAAVIERRNAALNMNVRLKASAFVNQFRGAGLDFEGFRGLLVGTERKRAGGRASVDAEQKNFRGEWLGGLIADMEKQNLMQAFTSGEFDRDAYTALYNLAKDGAGNEKLPKEAVAIAEIVNKYQSDARNTRNRFGTWIRDLQGYIVRQSHDIYKIRDAGEKAYKESVLPLLDLQRTMRDFEGSADDFLTRVYDDFAAGSHMKTAAGEDDMVAFGSGSSLARKESQSRVLYFKDGDAAYQYNQKFGQGKLAESVLGGLDQSAKSAGLLKLLGTNPQATAERLFKEYADTLRGDPKRRAAFLSHRKELDNLLAQIDGSVNIPGNVTAAKISSFVRSWQSMSKLGGMLISSVTDLTNYAAEMRFGQDKNLLSGTLDGMGALTRGRAAGEKRAVLISLGVFHESTLGAVFNRFDSPDLLGGKTAAAMQLFFKMSGINWWTESLRDGYALAHSAYVADQSGKAFDKLPDSLRDMLGLYNIDAGKWDVLRLAKTQMADGRGYITPDGLRTVPRAALENYILQAGRKVTDAAIMNLQDDLSSALRTMTIDRMHHAVIEPSARARAFMLRGTQPGTVPGELLRFVGQFKSFPVALIQSTLGREVYGRGYDTIGQYIKNGKGDMVGLASFIALSTAMGYAAMSAKDLLRGKNPRPVDDPRTWAAAMVQGGGLGIYGDFMFGKYNRMGGSLTGSMAGPVANTADTAADLWTRIRTGDDLAATSFNAGLQNTPFANLFYTRVALDYLVLYRIQESLNPGFLRRMEKRAERENGQTFYLPPSQVAR